MSHRLGSLGRVLEVGVVHRSEGVTDGILRPVNERVDGNLTFPELFSSSSAGFLQPGVVCVAFGTNRARILFVRLQPLGEVIADFDKPRSD